MEHLYDYYVTKLKIKGLEAACLLFESCHDKQLVKDCINLGYTVFDIRHPEGNWADPRTIEKAVLYDFWGYIALKNEKAIELLSRKISKDTFFQINRHSLNRFDDDIASFHSSEKLPLIID